MEVQVQEIIDKIKNDGIESASQEASRIKSAAENEARSIVEAAKKEAVSIILKGKEDAERSEKAGIAALAQASRNLILAFKDEIQALLDKIVAEQVTANYDENVLKAALPDLLKAWAKNADDMSVVLSENDLGKIQAFFGEKLIKELWNGVELKSSRKLNRGFYISNKEGSVYYDFSAEAVAQMLSAYLNPKLSEILKNSVKTV